MIEEQVHGGVLYRPYRHDQDLHAIRSLFSHELSEPYQVWTYRFFTEPYPELTLFAEVDDKIIGCAMSMLEPEACKVGQHITQAYLGMICVVDEYKGKGVSQHLFKLIENEWLRLHVTNAVIETEDDNFRAIKFYEKLGFYRSRHFYRYYMNGKGAYRLKKQYALPE